jgi:hypothetical protein
MKRVKPTSNASSNTHSVLIQAFDIYTDYTDGEISTFKRRLTHCILYNRL